MDGLEGEFRKLSIESLQAPHREIFSRAVSNILSSQIAEDTYAQIIDGLPLSHVVLDVSESNACPGHPLIEEHKELCAGVLDKAKELHSTFDMGLLEIDSRVRHTCQDLLYYKLTYHVPAYPRFPSSFSWLPSIQYSTH